MVGTRSTSAPIWDADGSSGNGMRVMILLGSLSNVVLIFMLRHFPYQDVPNHLARYALIERALFGIPVDWAHVTIVPTPYLAVDLLGAILVHLVGPHAAASTVAVMAITSLPLGMYVLLSAVAPQQRLWTLAAALLSGSVFLTNGMLNYQIGVGGLLMWLGIWWSRRHSTSSGIAIGLGFGVILLMLIHLSAGCVALLVVSCDLAVSCLSQLRIVEAEGRPADRWSCVRANLVCLFMGCCFLGMMFYTAPSARGVEHVLVMRSLRSKVWSVTEPLYAFTPWEMLATAGGYGVALGMYAWIHREVRQCGVLGVVALGLAALYIITPMTFSSTGIDVRWLLPLYLIVFAAIPGSRAAIPSVLGPALLTACILHTGILLSYGRRIDSQLNTFDSVLSRLPSDARLLPIVGGERRYGRVDPFLHYALWHTVNTGSRVGGIFSYVIQPIGQRVKVSIQFAHFRQTDISYAFYNPWRESGMPGVEWPTVRTQYDFVIQAGTDAALSTMLLSGACITDRQGSVSVYAVGGKCAAGTGQSSQNSH